MDRLPLIPNAGTPQESKINLRHYWHVVLERRWLVITAFLSIMLLTAIHLFRATPIYQASARIQIDRESENVLKVENPFSASTENQDYLQTQFKNLTSRTLLESVIKDLKLNEDLRYTNSADAVSTLASDITISPIRLSRLVDVKVEHSDRKQAQAIANRLVDTFVKRNLEQKVQSSEDAVTWLNTQVVDSKSALNKAEEALLAYRKKHNEVSLEEGENIARQRLLASQTDLSKVQAEATSAKRTVEEIDRLIKDGQSLDSIPVIASNPNVQRINQELTVQESTLAGLLKRYRDKYPRVIEARSQIAKLKDGLAQECEKQMATIRNSALILGQQESALAAVVEREEARQFELNQLRIQYDMLKRDADNTKSIYSNVLIRMKETELMSRMNSNNMRVVDPATIPLRPIKPRIVLTAFMGLVGGLGVALGLAFFVSYLDDSIKSQDDVESYLRLPFLGYVPNIKTNSVVERDLQAHLHPQSNAAEGFRTIRATLALSHKAERYRVISVTSTIPSEGKSLVASNIAIVHAQTGLKTLLVDADMRRPSVHKAYQLHAPVGLSAFLMKETDKLEDFTHESEIPNLDVICCGSIPSNPSELISSTRMMEFLEKVKGKYDRVVLDCPPISAVSDPLIISAMSDGVIYVTKFNKIRREHARKSVARIQNAGIHILGLVINDIDFEGKDSYYYSYYYYQNRYYSSYKNEGDSSKKESKESPSPVEKA